MDEYKIIIKNAENREIEARKIDFLIHRWMLEM